MNRAMEVLEKLRWEDELVKNGKAISLTKWCSLGRPDGWVHLQNYAGLVRREDYDARPLR